jgi:hypothetical protein
MSQRKPLVFDPLAEPTTADFDSTQTRNYDQFLDTLILPAPKNKQLAASTDELYMDDDLEGQSHTFGFRVKEFFKGIAKALNAFNKKNPILAGWLFSLAGLTVLSLALLALAIFVPPVGAAVGGILLPAAKIAGVSTFLSGLSATAIAAVGTAFLSATAIATDSVLTAVVKLFQVGINAIKARKASKAGYLPLDVEDLIHDTEFANADANVNSGALRPLQPTSTTEITTALASVVTPDVIPAPVPKHPTVESASTESDEDSSSEEVQVQQPAPAPVPVVAVAPQEAPPAYVAPQVAPSAAAPGSPRLHARRASQGAEPVVEVASKNTNPLSKSQ